MEQCHYLGATAAERPKLRPVRICEESVVANLAVFGPAVVPYDVCSSAAVCSY